MITLDIPGYGKIELKYIVSDYSGTLSVDGILCLGVKEKINELAGKLEIHILTSDTHGKASEQLTNVNCKFHILSGDNHTLQKAQHVEQLGNHQVMAIGNGNNDCEMLKQAQIGIAICLDEGCAISTLNNSDIIVKSALDAFDLLLKPNRLIASLRR